MIQISKILEGHVKWLAMDPAGEKANLRGANLRGANLWGANLQGANLRGANLREANLREANLWGANLQGANLQGANLREANLLEANLWGANLQGANLQGANLWGANLRGVLGNMREVRTIHVEKYDIAYTRDVIQIGCQRHPIETWWAFGDDEIANMDEGALDWWQVWKPLLMAIIKAGPAS